MNLGQKIKQEWLISNLIVLRSTNFDIQLNLTFKFLSSAFLFFRLAKYLKKKLGKNISYYSSCKTYEISRNLKTP